MENICIFRTPRDRVDEHNHCIKSELEFALRSFQIDKLQTAIRIFEDEDKNIQLCAWLRIARDRPLHPQAPACYSVNDDKKRFYNQPLIAQSIGITYGVQQEIRMPIPGKFPMLTTLLKYLQSNGCNLKDELELAEQLAPTLGIYGGWIEPALVDSGNSWKEAKIEYEQYFAAKEMSDGNIYAIKDIDGYIRHLICENYADGKICILPMTFAQHPNYRTPLVCHFIFPREWCLMGSEQLKLYPEAEVLITNELHCQNSNPTADRIFLNYFFGKEIIPFLKLECLRYRNVKILFKMTSNKQELRINLEEAILLMSRLKELDIKAEIMQINDDGPLNPEISDSGLPNVVFRYKPEKVGIEGIVKLGFSYGIKIPENLRPDRYGALIDRERYSLVDGFLNAGEVTAVTVHTGVDLTMVTCSIMSGMKKETIFPKKWSCNRKINPALFIKNNTVARHNIIFEKLSADNCSCYEIPTGTKDMIEDRLKHIVKENSCNVLFFEARQIVQEHRKELQTVCTWGQKHGIDIVIVTSQDDLAAEVFFSDICGKDIHFWWTEKGQYEYLVEDRPLLLGEVTAFKITFKQDRWDVQDNAEDELHEIIERNVSILHPKTKNDINLTSDPVTQYRR